MIEHKEEAPSRPPKKHVAVDIDWDLYESLKKIAEEDDVPLTVIYRWAFRDIVAGRKQA